MDYQAYWLTSEAGSEYVDLVLSRVPLQRLVRSTAIDDLTVLDCDAVWLTTYARDSVWNAGRHPVKVLARVDKVDQGEVSFAGRRFTYTHADLMDVLGILQNPEGRIVIHRIYGATAGQESEIDALAARLRKQLERKPEND